MELWWCDISHDTTIFPNGISSFQSVCVCVRTGLWMCVYRSVSAFVCKCLGEGGGYVCICLYICLNACVYMCVFVLHVCVCVCTYYLQKVLSLLLHVGVQELTEKKQQEFLEHQMRLGMQQEELMSVVEQRQHQDLEQQRNIVEKKHLARFGGSFLCLFDFVLVSPVLSLASVLFFDFLLVSPVLSLASVLFFDFLLVSPVLSLASVLFFDFLLVSPVLSLASVLFFDFLLVSPVLSLASVLFFDFLLVSPVLSLASVLFFDFVLVSPVLSLASVLLFPESDLFSLVWFWSVSMPVHFFVSLLQYNNTLLILKLKRKFSCPPLTNNKK